MLKKGTFAVICSISLLLAGCGRAVPPKLIPNDAVTHPPKTLPYDGKYWISYTFGPSVKSYYVLSSTKVSKIGRLLYNLHGTNPVNYAPSYWSTDDRNAVRVYSIPGVNSSKAVAIGLSNGVYIEAHSIGKKQP